MAFNQVYDTDFQDPFQVLGVDENMTFAQIKKAYDTLARYTHPDKGGNPDHYRKIKVAYSEIKKMYNQQSHTELKRNYEQRDDYEDGVLKRQLQDRGLDPDRISSKEFNELFDKLHLKDEADQGYGTRMTERGEREDAKHIKNIDPFDKAVENDGEPMAMISGADAFGNCYQLGNGRAGNFTDLNRGYTDYMEAHNDQTKQRFDDFIANNNRVKQFKSVEEYQAYSDSYANKELTDDEQRALLEKERRERMKEAIRRNRQQKRDRDVEDHFRRTMHLLASPNQQPNGNRDQWVDPRGPPL
jgi:curved DNA-binding protein CbpA